MSHTARYVKISWTYKVRSYLTPEQAVSKAVKDLLLNALQKEQTSAKVAGKSVAGKSIASESIAGDESSNPVSPAESKPKEGSESALRKTEVSAKPVKKNPIMDKAELDKAIDEMDENPRASMRWTGKGWKR